eukprot:Sdes_comp18470_c0_seq4m8451
MGNQVVKSVESDKNNVGLKNQSFENNEEKNQIITVHKTETFEILDSVLLQLRKLNTFLPIIPESINFDWSYSSFFPSRNSKDGIPLHEMEPVLVQLQKIISSCTLQIH